jgi:thiamine kinase-like enzyme
MVSQARDPESSVRVNRKRELTFVPSDREGNAMLGIAYLTGDAADTVRAETAALAADSRHDHDFWEATLYRGDRMIVPARVLPADDAVEINTYEQLRELDAHSNHLQSHALDTIASVFHTDQAAITDITVLKKGMTNRSFLFNCRGGTYIMRIPGEGTDQLIDRRQEAAVYGAISGRGLCDDPVFIDPRSGYKITRFLNGVRTCDPDSTADLERCMDVLRRFHDMDIRVEHSFDIFGHIDFYESLWNGIPSAYDDYAVTKANVMSLRPYIDAHAARRTLTHIDAVPDNFLFYTDESGQEQLQLTDWEYAGMQDPHVDIAMFCIYSLYDKPRVDRLIDIYFQGDCPPPIRAKIYCYVAACGLLWSNWCEYKSHLGVEFGEYSLQQYRYAKEYFRYAREYLEKDEGAHV